ncbi:MAG: ribonuclease R [Bacteroidetes bacterium]|nr:ribonuclease R [Bacteroidota bacterium]MBK8144490.1 ribonuclease R [Bacteroidota bacterium]
MKKKRTNKVVNPNSKSRRVYAPGVLGKIEITPQGMGYVVVPGEDIDIKVKRENVKNAMHGDTVEVVIIKPGKAGQKPEGLVSKIIKRGQNEMIGTVELSMNFAFVVPDNKSFTKDIFINEKNSKHLKKGDRVVVRITDWNEKQKNPEGEIVAVLTDEKVNEIAMKEILLQQGFSLEFPAEVLEELALVPTTISEEEIAQRKDMRGVLTLTIDPHDAKDFDDAISYEKLENGLHRIGVHIADVAHYVLPGTALDAEAYKRATSVYLPDRVLPMLPEKISNELCSLRPLEDKLTFSAIFDINDAAEVKNQWIGKTVIHSNKRFSYEEVQEIIETKEGPHKEIILILNQISQTLRLEKFQKGAINFTSEEARFVLDEHGVPEAVVVKESKESHQLIEELMLLANKTVAAYVSRQKYKGKSIPFPYRIHDSPDMERLEPFTRFAAKFGYSFDLSNPQTISASFNKMLSSTDAHPEHHILHMLGIRTMAKAVYATKNIGHYGLAFEHYCHFTSPIRRYPDVLVHRILLQCLQQKITPIADMDEQCVHTSERERKAMDAERDATKYKQVEFMRKYIGEEFDAVISGVSPFGFWAQTVLQRCEGFISILHLPDTDEYKHIEEEYAIVGKRTKKKYQIGNPVRVKVVSANLQKKQIDFDLVS